MSTRSQPPLARNIASHIFVPFKEIDQLRLAKNAADWSVDDVSVSVRFQTQNERVSAWFKGLDEAINAVHARHGFYFPTPQRAALQRALWWHLQAGYLRLPYSITVPESALNPTKVKILCFPSNENNQFLVRRNGQEPYAQFELPMYSSIQDAVEADAGIVPEFRNVDDHIFSMLLFRTSIQIKQAQQFRDAVPGIRKMLLLICKQQKTTPQFIAAMDWAITRYLLDPWLTLANTIIGRFAGNIPEQVLRRPSRWSAKNVSDAMTYADCQPTYRAIGERRHLFARYPILKAIQRAHTENRHLPLEGLCAHSLNAVYQARQSPIQWFCKSFDAPEWAVKAYLGLPENELQDALFENDDYQIMDAKLLGHTNVHAIGIAFVRHIGHGRIPKNQSEKVTLAKLINVSICVHSQPFVAEILSSSTLQLGLEIMASHSNNLEWEISHFIDYWNWVRSIHELLDLDVSTLKIPTIERIKELSGRWHDAERWAQSTTQELDDGHIESTTWPPLIDRPMSYQGLTVHSVCSRQELRKIASQMGNCLATYEHSCRIGRKHIVSFNKGRHRVAVFSIDASSVGKNTHFSFDQIEEENGRSKSNELKLKHLAKAFISDLNGKIRESLNPAIQSYRYETADELRHHFMAAPYAGFVQAYKQEPQECLKRYSRCFYVKGMNSTKFRKLLNARLEQKIELYNRRRERRNAT